MPSDCDSTLIKNRQYPGSFTVSTLASPCCCADEPESDFSALAEEIAMPNGLHVNVALLHICLSEGRYRCSVCLLECCTVSLMFHFCQATVAKSALKSL